MSVANLTRYEVEMCHCALGEHMETVARTDGEFVKFEEAMEASSNSLQQLKAEIAALCNSFVKGRRDLFLDEFVSKYERLRQLSAV